MSDSLSAYYWTSVAVFREAPVFYGVVFSRWPWSEEFPPQIWRPHLQTNIAGNRQHFVNSLSWWIFKDRNNGIIKGKFFIPKSKIPNFDKGINLEYQFTRVGACCFFNYGKWSSVFKLFRLLVSITVLNRKFRLLILSNQSKSSILQVQFENNQNLAHR